MLLQLNQSTPFAGLVTATYKTLTDGVYRVQVYATIPQGSNLLIEVNSDGTDPDYEIGGTADSLGPALGGFVDVTAAAGDTITVTLSSSATVDSIRNAVKGTINLFQSEKTS